MTEVLGDFSISEGLFNFIQENIPRSSTLLEFGSGYGSSVLAQFYTVFSVEHDEEWVGKYPNVNYIYAPIKKHKEVRRLVGDHWYDWSVLSAQIVDISYDLIIVDGPPIRYGRAGFFKYMIPQPRPVPIVFDDLHRRRDLDVALKVSKYLKEPLVIKDAWETKTFGYIWPGRNL